MAQISFKGTESGLIRAATGDLRERGVADGGHRASR